MPRKKKPPVRSKWKEEYGVVIYQMLKDGKTLATIGRTLGVGTNLVAAWVKTRPAAMYAYAEAGKTPKEKNRGFVEFKDYVSGRLPKDARELWDRIESLDHSDDPEALKDRDECLDLISARPTVIQQHLFLHALLNCNFMTSHACAKLGLDKTIVRHWMMNDPVFRKLVEGIHEHKKDFFESALIDLVRKGDSAATIFANRTLNRDRGYDQKISVDMTTRNEVTHRHTVSLEELPLEVQRAALEAIRAKKASNLALEDHSDVEDAEVIE